MRRLQLLLIDDDPHDRALIEKILTKDAPTVTLTTCTTATEALTRLQNPDIVRPQVIFLDLNHPPLSGLTLLDLLKAGPELRHITVLMFSVLDDPEHIRAAYAKQVNTYVVKGQTFAELQRQVLAFLQFWNVSLSPAAGAAE